jgi:hypothetical protein
LSDKEDFTPEELASSNRMLEAADVLKHEILQFVHSRHAVLLHKLEGSQEAWAAMDFALAQAFVANVMAGSKESDEKDVADMTDNELQELKNDAFVKAVRLLRGLRVNGLVEPE